VVVCREKVVIGLLKIVVFVFLICYPERSQSPGSQFQGVSVVPSLWLVSALKDFAHHITAE
jgi:hypothetical protein